MLVWFLEVLINKIRFCTVVRGARKKSDLYLEKVKKGSEDKVNVPNQNSKNVQTIINNPSFRMFAPFVPDL